MIFIKETMAPDEYHMNDPTSHAHHVQLSILTNFGYIFDSER